MINENDLTALPKPSTERLSIANILASIVVIIGFIAVIGFLFYKNLTDAAINRDKILIRQVELLNILKMSADEQEMEQAVQEYDSLARVLEVLDNR